MYDIYKSYSPGFLGVGTLSVLGALILPVIVFVLPAGNNGQQEQDGELTVEKAKQGVKWVRQKSV